MTFGFVFRSSIIKCEQFKHSCLLMYFNVSIQIPKSDDVDEGVLTFFLENGLKHGLPCSFSAIFTKGNPQRWLLKDLWIAMSNELLTQSPWKIKSSKKKNTKKIIALTAVRLTKGNVPVHCCGYHYLHRMGWGQPPPPKKYITIDSKTANKRIVTFVTNCFSL